MKTYKLLNVIRYVDARTARRLIDASLSENLAIAVKGLGSGGILVDKDSGKTLSELLGNVIDATRIQNPSEASAFGRAMQTFLNAVAKIKKTSSDPAKNSINSASISTALKEAAAQNKERLGVGKQKVTGLTGTITKSGYVTYPGEGKEEDRKIYVKGGYDKKLSTGYRTQRSKAYLENQLNKRSEVRSPANVSMVGRPAIVAPSKSWKALKSSVERWAQQSASGLKLGKDGKVYYNGKRISENNIPSSIAGIVEYYPNKEEAIKGINNILRTKLEKRRMSIVNAVKGNQRENAAVANAYRLRNKNKLDPGLEEEFRNEGLSHSKSNYQRATAGKPDGQRQRKITLANDIALLLGNKGLSASEYSNRKRIWAKHAPADDKALNEYNKSFDMSKGEQIDAKTARDAIAYIKSGISNLKMGNDREASEDFWRAKKVLSKAGYRGKTFAKNFPSLNNGLTSLMTLIKRKDSGYSIRNRMTNPICYADTRCYDALDDKSRFEISSNMLTKSILDLSEVGESELRDRVMGIQHKLGKIPLDRVKQNLSMIMKLIQKSSQSYQNGEDKRLLNNSIVALREARDILPK